RIVVGATGSGGIVTIAAGGGGPWMKVLRLREVLPDEIGADHSSICHDETAVRPVREKRLSDPGHRKRVTIPRRRVKSRFSRSAGKSCWNMWSPYYARWNNPSN